MVKQRKKESGYVIRVPNDEGKLVKIVLQKPPAGKGTVSTKKIREAIKKVRNARLKAEAAG